MKLTAFKAVKKGEVQGLDTFIGGLQIRHGNDHLYFIWSDIHRLNRIDAIADAHNLAFQNDLTIKD